MVQKLFELREKHHHQPKKCPWTIWANGALVFCTHCKSLANEHIKRNHMPKKIKVKPALWPAQFSVVALICHRPPCAVFYPTRRDPFFRETSTTHFLLTLLYSRWSRSWLTNRLTFPWFGRVKPFDESKTPWYYFRTFQHFFMVENVKIALLSRKKYIRRVKEGDNSITTLSESQSTILCSRITTWL